MTKSAKLSINNTLMGDYTAQIEIGSEKHIANLILDTGSSTLAVWKSKFGDAKIQPTDFVQFVRYGTGHWAGPILRTQVGFGSGSNYISLANTTIAQIQSGIYQGKKQFYPADGILGLAFKSLNIAANVGLNYPISRYDTENKWQGLSSRFENIDPYFVDLEKIHLAANKYAFLTRRSSINQSVDPQNDPLNKGWFILGGDKEYTRLFTGNFQSVKVVSDKYWNTKIIQIKVGTDDPISIPSLSELKQEHGKDFSYLGSNSIIDSGTNSISLYQDAYWSLIQSFKNLGKPFYKSLTQYFSFPSTFSLSPSELKLWPSIFVTLVGTNNSTVTLEIKPENYWQTNATQGGATTFKIEPSQQPQSILGLPLMNNYYVVFDRSNSKQGLGEIKFATQNPSGYPN